jgi:hypothetical protein
MGEPSNSDAKKLLQTAYDLGFRDGIREAISMTETAKDFMNDNTVAVLVKALRSIPKMTGMTDDAH